MSYKVLLAPNFKKEAKRLLKKYPSLKGELVSLFDALITNPTMGESLGHHLYKIRLAIASKGKGKSGGARVISYVQLPDEVILLLSIYNKGERDTISIQEILDLLESS